MGSQVWGWWRWWGWGTCGVLGPFEDGFLLKSQPTADTLVEVRRFSWGRVQTRVGDRVPPKKGSFYFNLAAHLHAIVPAALTSSFR